MEREVSYDISQVTVYPDRALVTCLGTATVTAGEQLIVFDNLPLSMEPDSVRIRGGGDTPVRILSVDVVPQHFEQVPAPQVVTILEEIRNVNDEIRTVDDDYAVWQAEAKLLDGMRQETAAYAKGLAKGQLTVENQSALVRYIREHDREIRQHFRELDALKAELQPRLEKLQHELAELESSRPLRRFQARVAISADGEGSFLPELSYVVNRAQWRPIYDLQYSPGNAAGDNIEVTTFAQVSQDTGQDWENVTLIVSTARPMLNQRAPRLDPWYIDVLQQPIPRAIEPPNRSAKAQRFMAANALAQSAPLNDGEPEYFEAEAASVAVRDQDAVVTYEVAAKCQVASDGAPHKYQLQQLGLPVDLRYLTVPKHTDAVFRLLTVTNTSNAPLLSGEANLFLNEEFIAKTEIEFAPAESEFDLIAGAEERIEVKRELKRRAVDKKLLKDNRVVTYGYEIKVKNLLHNMAEVELREHIPVSRNEEIRVKLEDSKPQPTRQSDLNILEWDLSIETGAEIIISYQYSVQYPRTIRVTGLVE